MKCNDDEINDLENEKTIKYDKRNYCQFYISLLKAKHDILFISSLIMFIILKLLKLIYYYLILF